MPSLVFDVRDGSGNDIASVRVTMDGALLAEKLTGAAVEVNPGEHHFVFDRSDGSSRAETTVVVREADKDRRVRVVVHASPDDTRSPTVSTAPEHASSTPPSAYVAFGVAGAGLIVGGVFTTLWFVENGKCSDITQGQCLAENPNHVGELNAYTAALIAGYGVAAVGGGLGVLFLLNASANEDGQTAVGVRPRIGIGWASIEGVFR
jgi:hypothetical protein